MLPSAPSPCYCPGLWLCLCCWVLPAAPPDLWPSMAALTPPGVSKGIRVVV